MIEFFMPMKSPPTTTHQMKQVNFKTKQFYEPPEVARARDQIRAALAQHVPEAKLLGPLRLTVKWCFAPGKHPDPSYKDTKPDTDNLQKLLKDEMTHCGYWQDDAQVASEIIEKFWATPTGIYIKVEEL